MCVLAKKTRLSPPRTEKWYKCAAVYENILRRVFGVGVVDKGEGKVVLRWRCSFGKAAIK
jgi:hypothetical protein